MSLENEEKTVSCPDCGEAFSNFLEEMAEKNAQVTTCPKCGKIHQPAGRQSEDATPEDSTAAEPVADRPPVRK
jgi:ssDNA-binding Zn-finger/Zn-ribbon topoisomerase 1